MTNNKAPTTPDNTPLTEKKMNGPAAIQTLQVFNEWRRGDREDCDDPKTIGDAIDYAIGAIDREITQHVKAALQNAQPASVDVCKLRLEITKQLNTVNAPEHLCVEWASKIAKHLAAQGYLHPKPGFVNDINVVDIEKVRADGPAFVDTPQALEGWAALLCYLQENNYQITAAQEQSQ